MEPGLHGMIEAQAPAQAYQEKVAPVEVSGLDRLVSNPAGRPEKRRVILHPVNYNATRAKAGRSIPVSQRAT